MHNQCVTIAGGSGFLGRYVVKHLANEGWRIRVLCTDTIAAQHLKPLGQVGQITLQYADICKPDSLQGVLKSSDAVINLVGILYESGKHTFKNVHTEGTRHLVEEAKRAGVSEFIQISALGVDKASKSRYAQSKLEAENIVRQEFPSTSIIRPSILFGSEDNFFNQFAKMSLIAPALPLIGGGHTRFQPVYVDDAARAIVACLNNEAAQGNTYELGGPKIYSFKALLEYLGQVIEKPRTLLPIPFAAANLIGCVAQQLPKPPLTNDQVKLLHYDNIISDDALTLNDLGIEATPIESVVPQYLSHFRRVA
ncbi:MAG: complex I NDUFA9 subunit family protein [Rickettsiales bacterium]|nr:complex I NDUFA9 subunit family protein [Rickettsiales bacterium]